MQYRSLNHQHLSCEYYHNDGEQTLASAEVERRTSRLEGSRVEQIEEVSHDEYGEQQREFVCREVSLGPEGQSAEACEELQIVEREHIAEAAYVGMFEHEQEEEQQHEEQCAHSYNLAVHGACQNEGVAVARTVVHYALRRRQRRQSHGCEGVHNQIYPQHLGHRERRLGAHEGSDEHYQTSRNVDGELEEQKSLYVLIQ